MYRQATILVSLLSVAILFKGVTHLIPNYIATSIKSTAINNNVNLELKNVEFEFPLNIQVEKTNLIFPIKNYNYGFPLTIDALSFDIGVLPFILLNFSGELKAAMYGGSLNGELSHSLWNNHGELSARLSQVNIANHPLANKFGCNGIFNSTVNKLTWQNSVEKNKLGRANLKSLDLQLEIIDASYFGGHTINQLIRLPKIDRINATANISLQGNTVLAKAVQIASSIGEINGQIQGKMDDRYRVNQLTSTLNITLQGEGKTTFNGFLALQAGLPTDSAVSSWEVRADYISGSIPKVSVKASTL